MLRQAFQLYKSLLAWTLALLMLAGTFALAAVMGIGAIKGWQWIAGLDWTEIIVVGCGIVGIGFMAWLIGAPR